MLDSKINQKFNRPIANPQFRASQNVTKPVKAEEKQGMSTTAKWAIGLGLTALASYGVYYALTKGRVKAPKPTPNTENPIPEIKEMAIDAFKRGKDATKEGVNRLVNGRAILADGTKYTGSITSTGKDGSKVVMEYVDGVLQKSTKTAKDGTKIFDKIYEVNDKLDKTVKIIKNDKTEIVNLTEVQKLAKAQQYEIKSLIKNNEYLSSEAFKKRIDGIQYKNRVQTEAVNTILQNKQAEEKLLNQAISDLVDLEMNVSKLSRHELEKIRYELGSYGGKIQTLEKKSKEGSLTRCEKLVLEKLRKQLEIVKNREAEIEKSLESFVPTVNSYSQLSKHHELTGHNCLIREYIEGNLNGSNGMRAIDKDEQEFLKKLIKDIDDEFLILEPLEKDCIVYRGRAEHSLFPSLNKDFQIIDSSKIGDIITPDQAYSYTAFHRSLAEHWGGEGARGFDTNGNLGRTIMYEIHLPKGSRVSRNFEHGGEVVMPRGAQYKIKDKKEHKDGCIEVILEYLLPKDI